MKAARFVFVLAVLAALLLLIAGPGTRLEWWSFRTGFTVMRWAAYLGLGAAGLALLGLLVPRTRRAQGGLVLAALAIAAIVAWVPWNGLRQARSLPPIHDISTDTLDPPAFVAVLPLRADAPNSAEHAGEAIAVQQRAGYPELRSLPLDLPADAAFARALQAAEQMGWEIVAADPGNGRIEATDTTFWFGFKDDVVVRVRPEGEGSRIDVRSVSRVGGSDVGANAARIRAYLRRLQR
ncbi:MAG: DUF1499 domain-containing protein [Pseudomonadota bacterium]|nr:DUF1499 domain-containing protein [Pseudomonadota bacterium]